MKKNTISNKSLIIVTGISGAGKSSAQNILEDLGYYVVHNLPVQFLPQFLEYSESFDTPLSRISLLPEVKSKQASSDLLSFIDTCRACSIDTNLMFIDCKTETIVKRYSESRRPHPEFEPTKDQSLIDTVERERTRLVDIKQAASIRIDSSKTNIHDLRRLLREFVESLEKNPPHTTRVNFLSFGFKYGVPYDCDLVMDVRFLPNPYFVEELREKTGLTKEVANHVLSFDSAQEFLSKYMELLNFLIPKYIDEGKAYINIGIGCTGGKHRSVAIAEKLASSLSFKKCLVSAKHRDLGNE